MLLTMWLPAAAQEFRYRVELAVSTSLQALLEDNLDIYKWRDNPEMNLDFLRRLHQRTPAEIRTLLATEGYFSPEIRATLAQEDGVWVARFEIEPGEPVRVGEVNLQFTGVIAAPEGQARIAQLRAQWPLAVREVFRQAAWEAAKRSLLRTLLIHRYPRATISDSQVRVDPLRRTASLMVTIDSGPEFRFGELEIVGLERYPERIVRNLSPIAPGDPYSQGQLLELQARLQDTRYFSSVEVGVEIETDTPQAAPVRVEVIEAESRRVGFGVGYSTDTGPRGRIEYTDINLRDRGWRLTTGLNGNALERTAAAGIDFPVRRNGARDSVTSSFTRKDISGEVTDTSRVAIARAQRAGRFERTLSMQYQHEVKEIAGAPGDTVQALTASAAWTLRDVDDLLFPTRGHLLNVQLSGAPQSELSDQSFLRGYIRGMRYHPVGRNGTLLLRAETGKVQADSRAGIPSDFLFRTGGDQSVRGYAYNSIGVREGDAIVGGRYLAVLSAEFDYWILPRWGAGLFYDAGNATDTLDEFSFFAGYGIGARWRSPVGPVNLDVAYGEETKGYRVHFAVGFVF